MFKQEIDKKFTEKIMEYMNKGYFLYTNTMAGSQGELAKVDLTNGEEVIRIYMDRTYVNLSDKKVFIAIGRSSHRPTYSDSEIIWTSKLEILEKMSFVKIGENYYVPEEEYNEIYEKRKNRYSDNYKIYIFKDEAKKIVLPYLKRQPKCKSMKLSDIKEVRKETYKNNKTNEVETEYFVSAKDRTYKINKVH